MTPANKKIIIVGGSNRSGTTMLNLIIANDERAMALGEVGHLFRPHFKEHQDKIDELLKDERWRKVIEGGKKNLYSNLIELFPEVDIFVDSTKMPEWGKAQMRFNPNLNIKNIISFKHPQDLLKSFSKRNATADGERTIHSYYEKSFFMFPNFRSIGLSALVKNEEAFKKLCAYLEIPYFETKKEFWNRKHPNFFGSPTITPFIDLSRIKDIDSIEDLENCEIEISERTKDIYKYLLERSVWKDADSFSTYKISPLRKSYLLARNKVSKSTSRVKYLLGLK